VRESLLQTVGSLVSKVGHEIDLRVSAATGAAKALLRLLDKAPELALQALH